MKKHLSISIASLLALSVPGIITAQNVFVADYNSGNIYEFTSGGARSTFASGLNGPARTGL
jgi:hypothetical protein